MTQLTVELPPDIYERLNTVALQRHTSIEHIAQEWLTKQSTAAQPLTAREQAREALRAAGLLAELSPEEKAHADASKATLEDVSAVLSRGDGPLLSEIVLEMRGPKE